MTENLGRPILVLGANGQVGHELLRCLAPLGNVRGLGRAELDLADADALRSCLRALGPRLVVNAAATARHRGLLEAINRGLPGFAAGGYAGGTPASSGSLPDWADLTGDFRMLSGAVSQLVQDIIKTRDPLASLASVIGSVSSAFLNQAVGAVGDWAGSCATKPDPTASRLCQ